MPVLQGGIGKEINKFSYIQTGGEAKTYVPIWNACYQIQLSHKVVKNRIFKSHFFPAGQLRGFPALRLGASMECRGEKIATCLCHSGPQVPRMSLIMNPRKFSWPPKGISSIDHSKKTLDPMFKLSRFFLGMELSWQNWWKPYFVLGTLIAFRLSSYPSNWENTKLTFRWIPSRVKSSVLL